MSKCDVKNCPCGLTTSEIEVLEMSGGIRPWEQGSWVNACVEFLEGFGLMTRDGDLTKRGQIVLNSKLCGDL